MPPKARYSKEEIVNIALEVASKKGMEGLTAKELASALGTSTSPIFTVFDTMQELQEEVRDAAMARFESYAHKIGTDMPPFKQVGMQTIVFAKEEPKLYALLFMSANSGVRSFEDIYAKLGEVAVECLDTIEHDYGLSSSDARTLFEHVWIHTFGIGTMCATGTCNFSYEQISAMLTQDFKAMMLLLKSGGNK